MIEIMIQRPVLSVLLRLCVTIVFSSATMCPADNNEVLFLLVLTGLQCHISLSYHCEACGI